MNLQLRIERLVLNGIEVAPARRPALRAAVEAELTRLLAGGGIAPELLTRGTTARVSGGPVELGGQPEPGLLGSRIAHAVHRGIGR
jgi:sugar (pentulose or hexulose) kinase